GCRPPVCCVHTQNILQEKDLRSPHSHESRIPVPASPRRLREESGWNIAGYAHRILWRVCHSQIPCSHHLYEFSTFSLMGIALKEKRIHPCEVRMGQHLFDIPKRDRTRSHLSVRKWAGQAAQG